MMGRPTLSNNRTAILTLRIRERVRGLDLYVFDEIERPAIQSSRRFTFVSDPGLWRRDLAWAIGTAGPLILGFDTDAARIDPCLYAPSGFPRPRPSKSQ